MNIPTTIKDLFYKALQEPTLENVRELLQKHTGEENCMDFKEKWVDPASLAKIMLAMANSGGGMIIFGVHENEDKSTSCEGLDKLCDKSEISRNIQKFIPDNLQYKIYDFSYENSEYNELIEKNFQVMIIEDIPEFLPFFCRSEGGDKGSKIYKNRIYVRRGTSDMEINEFELNQLIKRKVNFEYPNCGKPLNLQEHLSQLETLYQNIRKNNTIAHNSQLRRSLSTWLFPTKSEPNPLYPQETYEEYLVHLIAEKKKKIERVLELNKK